LEGKEWLVGDKCTYADLSFYMWHIILPLSMVFPEGETPLSAYPNVLAWHKRMAERPSVKKVIEIRQSMMDAEGLGKDALPTDVSLEDMVEQLQA
jgi:glutathione S-transferase